MKHIDAVDAVPLNHLKHINAVYHSTFQPVWGRLTRPAKSLI
jgi:hypothetical protein